MDRLLHEMTLAEAAAHFRSLYDAQPKADWDMLAVGNVILHKGWGWRIIRIPPKRGFIVAENVMTGQTEKLLRRWYDTPDLLVSDESTLAVLRSSHREAIEAAIAAGVSIRPAVQYDYPELFTPFPNSWDEKRRENAQSTWRRINEMRAFHDQTDTPGWQLRHIDRMTADAKAGIRRWTKYRAEVEAGVGIKTPEAIPRLVSNVDETISRLKEDIIILRHLRKHARNTLQPDDGELSRMPPSGNGSAVMSSERQPAEQRP